MKRMRVGYILKCLHTVYCRVISEGLPPPFPPPQPHARTKPCQLSLWCGADDLLSGTQSEVLWNILQQTLWRHLFHLRISPSPLTWKKIHLVGLVISGVFSRIPGILPAVCCCACCLSRWPRDLHVFMPEAVWVCTMYCYCHRSVCVWGGDYVTTLESFRSCCSTDVASCFELFSCSSLFANKEQPRGEPVALGKCCFSTSENVRDNKRMNSVSHNAPAASAEWAQRDFFSSSIYGLRVYCSQVRPLSYLNVKMSRESVLYLTHI